MPCVSHRRQLIADLTSGMAVEALDEEDYEDFLLLDSLFDADGDLSLDSFLGEGGDLWIDTLMDDLAEVLMLVEANRYLTPHQLYDKSRDFVLNYFFNLPDDSFRQLTRISKVSFQFVLSEIEGCPVFQNDSLHPQADVALQLTVTLDRLGDYGNGVSLGGKWTCVLYTTRVLEVLNDLASKFIVWSNKRKRKSMSRRMAAKIFKGCVGFIDGTTFPHYHNPTVDGECYFDRKSRYSINGQILCDDNRRVIAFYAGWRASCCDSTVYKKMQLTKDFKKPHFFSPGEYLIGDLAYQADHGYNTLVPAYRKNMKDTDIEAFNTFIAHVRVVNEHTIGVLKGRMLHNMLLSQNDHWTSDDEISDEDSNEPEEEESIELGFTLNATACFAFYTALTIKSSSWDITFIVTIKVSTNATLFVTA
ncbi:hypothetical protein PHMEG_00025957 [Phytophthora megakarya]|uniref:DDE Tnp4 domain-containing protein n=1 Tax=Phytophthora megakarya TaxID=4795 RepID=A0A225VAR5_9STRA|nr:hypothetical protein PHMEG_00025957 [Phytophthora megakarya]